MTISLIIPIYNSIKFLPELLKCLENNKFKKNDEIIFVDNGSTDNSYETCLEFCKKNSELYKVLRYTDKTGSYAARNYAIKYSKGEVLIFTDSDTKPIDDWINIIRKKIKPNTIVAGKIQLEIINNTLWEYFDSIAHLQSEKNAKENFVATANMAVYREDFMKVGFFEERFSGGDYQWSNNAVTKGMTIKFIPEALVYHPTRNNFSEILKKEQRIAYGTGNHYKTVGKSLFSLVILYSLKFFKIDTNLKYSKMLIKKDVEYKEIIKFNFKFFIIRFEQLKYAIKGYKMIDVRKLKIK